MVETTIRKKENRNRKREQSKMSITPSSALALSPIPAAAGSRSKQAAITPPPLMAAGPTISSHGKAVSSSIVDASFLTNPHLLVLEQFHGGADDSDDDEREKQHSRQPAVTNAASTAGGSALSTVMEDAQKCLMRVVDETGPVIAAQSAAQRKAVQTARERALDLVNALPTNAAGGGTGARTIKSPNGGDDAQDDDASGEEGKEKREQQQPSSKQHQHHPQQQQQQHSKGPVTVIGGAAKVAPSRSFDASDAIMAQRTMLVSTAGYHLQQRLNQSKFLLPSNCDEAQRRDKDLASTLRDFDKLARNVVSDQFSARLKSGSWPFRFSGTGHHHQRDQQLQRERGEDERWLSSSATVTTATTSTTTTTTKTAAAGSRDLDAVNNGLGELAAPWRESGAARPPAQCKALAAEATWKDRGVRCVILSQPRLLEMWGGSVADVLRAARDEVKARATIMHNCLSCRRVLQVPLCSVVVCLGVPVFVEVDIGLSSRSTVIGGGIFSEPVFTSPIVKSFAYSSAGDGDDHNASDVVTPLIDSFSTRGMTCDDLKANNVSNFVLRAIGYELGLAPHRIFKDPVVFVNNDAELHLSPFDNFLYIRNVRRLLPPILETAVPSTTPSSLSSSSAETTASATATGKKKETTAAAAAAGDSSASGSGGGGESDGGGNAVFPSSVPLSAATASIRARTQEPTLRFRPEFWWATFRRHPATFLSSDAHRALFGATAQAQAMAGAPADRAAAAAAAYLHSACVANLAEFLFREATAASSGTAAIINWSSVPLACVSRIFHAFGVNFALAGHVMRIVDGRLDTALRRSAMACRTVRLEMAARAAAEILQARLREVVLNPLDSVPPSTTLTSNSGSNNSNNVETAVRARTQAVAKSFVQRLMSDSLSDVGGDDSHLWQSKILPTISRMFRYGVSSSNSNSDNVETTNTVATREEAKKIFYEMFLPPTASSQSTATALFLDSTNPPGGSSASATADEIQTRSTTVRTTGPAGVRRMVAAASSSPSSLVGVGGGGGGGGGGGPTDHASVQRHRHLESIGDHSHQFAGEMTSPNVAAAMAIVGSPVSVTSRIDVRPWGSPTVNPYDTMPRIHQQHGDLFSAQKNPQSTSSIVANKLRTTVSRGENSNNNNNKATPSGGVSSLPDLVISPPPVSHLMAALAKLKAASNSSSSSSAASLPTASGANSRATHASAQQLLQQQQLQIQQEVLQQPPSHAGLSLSSSWRDERLDYLFLSAAAVSGSRQATSLAHVAPFLVDSQQDWRLADRVLHLCGIVLREPSARERAQDALGRYSCTLVPVTASSLLMEQPLLDRVSHVASATQASAVFKSLQGTMEAVRSAVEANGAAASAVLISGMLSSGTAGSSGSGGAGASAATASTLDLCMRSIEVARLMGDSAQYRECVRGAVEMLQREFYGQTSDLGAVPLLISLSRIDADSGSLATSIEHASLAVARAEQSLAGSVFLVQAWENVMDCVRASEGAGAGGDRGHSSSSSSASSAAPAAVGARSVSADVVLRLRLETSEKLRVASRAISDQATGATLGAADALEQLTTVFEWQSDTLVRASLLHVLPPAEARRHEVLAAVAALCGCAPQDMCPPLYGVDTGRMRESWNDACKAAVSLALQQGGLPSRKSATIFAQLLFRIVAFASLARYKHVFVVLGAEAAAAAEEAAAADGATPAALQDRRGSYSRGDRGNNFVSVPPTGGAAAAAAAAVSPSVRSGASGGNRLFGIAATAAAAAGGGGGIDDDEFGTAALSDQERVLCGKQIDALRRTDPTMRHVSWIRSFCRALAGASSLQSPDMSGPLAVVSQALIVLQVDLRCDIEALEGIYKRCSVVAAHGGGAGNLAAGLLGAGAAAAAAANPAPGSRRSGGGGGSVGAVLRGGSPHSTSDGHTTETRSKSHHDDGVSSVGTEDITAGGLVGANVVDSMRARGVAWFCGSAHQQLLLGDSGAVDPLLVAQHVALQKVLDRDAIVFFRLWTERLLRDVPPQQVSQSYLWDPALQRPLCDLICAMHRFNVFPELALRVAREVVATTIAHCVTSVEPVWARAKERSRIREQAVAAQCRENAKALGIKLMQHPLRLLRLGLECAAVPFAVLPALLDMGASLLLCAMAPPWREERHRAKMAELRMLYGGGSRSGGGVAGHGRRHRAGARGLTALQAQHLRATQKLIQQDQQLMASVPTRTVWHPASVQVRQRPAFYLPSGEYSVTYALNLSSREAFGSSEEGGGGERGGRGGGGGTSHRETDKAGAADGMDTSYSATFHEKHIHNMNNNTSSCGDVLEKSGMSNLTMERSMRRSSAAAFMAQNPASATHASAAAAAAAEAAAAQANVTTESGKDPYSVLLPKTMDVALSGADRLLRFVEEALHLLHSTAITHSVDRSTQMAPMQIQSWFASLIVREAVGAEMELVEQTEEEQLLLLQQQRQGSSSAARAMQQQQRAEAAFRNNNGSATKSTGTTATTILKRGLEGSALAKWFMPASWAQSTSAREQMMHSMCHLVRSTVSSQQQQQHDTNNNNNNNGNGSTSTSANTTPQQVSGGGGASSFGSVSRSRDAAAQEAAAAAALQSQAPPPTARLDLAAQLGRIVSLVLHSVLFPLMAEARLLDETGSGLSKDSRRGVWCEIQNLLLRIILISENASASIPFEESILLHVAAARRDFSILSSPTLPQLQQPANKDQPIAQQQQQQSQVKPLYLLHLAGGSKTQQQSATAGAAAESGNSGTATTAMYYTSVAKDPRCIPAWDNLLQEVEAARRRLIASHCGSAEKHNSSPSLPHVVTHNVTTLMEIERIFFFFESEEAQKKYQQERAAASQGDATAGSAATINLEKARATKRIDDLFAPSSLPQHDGEDDEAPASALEEYAEKMLKARAYETAFSFKSGGRLPRLEECSFRLFVMTVASQVGMFELGALPSGQAAFDASAQKTAGHLERCLREEAELAQSIAGERRHILSSLPKKADAATPSVAAKQRLAKQRAAERIKEKEAESIAGCITVAPHVITIPHVAPSAAAVPAAASSLSSLSADGGATDSSKKGSLSFKTPPPTLSISWVLPKHATPSRPCIAVLPAGSTLMLKHAVLTMSTFEVRTVRGQCILPFKSQRTGEFVVGYFTHTGQDQLPAVLSDPILVNQAPPPR